LVHRHYANRRYIPVLMVILDFERCKEFAHKKNEFSELNKLKRMSLDTEYHSCIMACCEHISRGLFDCQRGGFAPNSKWNSYPRTCFGALR
jgi:hypothetical protein